MLSINSLFSSILLPFCSGDLGSVISKKKRLSEDIARIYAAEITLALEALHKKDIIFRYDFGGRKR